MTPVCRPSSSGNCPRVLKPAKSNWPVPKAFRVGQLLNYGYRKPAAAARTSKSVCRLRGKRRFDPSPACALAEPAASNAFPKKLTSHCNCQCAAPAMQASTFAAAQARQPMELPGQSVALVQGQRLQLRIAGLPAQLLEQALTLLPETPDVLQHAAIEGKATQQAWEGAVLDCRLAAVAHARRNASTQLPFVLTLAEADSAAPLAWRAVTTVQGRWDSVPAASVPPHSLPHSPPMLQLEPTATASDTGAHCSAA